MAEQATAGTLTAPTAEQRRIAQESFNKAKELIADGGYDYAIQMLLTCCKLDPGNFFYRQTLRKTQKDKFGNNLRGSRFAFITTPRWKSSTDWSERRSKAERKQRAPVASISALAASISAAPGRVE